MNGFRCVQLPGEMIGSAAKKSPVADEKHADVERFPLRGNADDIGIATGRDDFLFLHRLFN